MRYLASFIATHVVLLAFMPQAFADTTVCVSVAGENRVITFDLNESSGELDLQHSIRVSGGPGSMAVDPDGNRLYVAVRGSSKIAAINIHSDRRLSLIGEVDGGGDASYLSVDPSGRFLFSSFYRDGVVRVHSIRPNGSLSSKPIQVVSTDEKAHAAVLDPTGKFLFVPHTRPNAIFQFRVGIGTGQLSPNDPLKVLREENSGPRHLWFHPRLQLAVGSDEQGSSVTSYDFNAKQGTLSIKQTMSTLPADFEDKNSTSDIEIHPSGKFLYVANRGHDSLAGFSIDAMGRLEPIGHAPTEKTPRSFNISPDGAFLVAAGQAASRLAVYQVRTDGQLERLASKDVGPRPWWVLILQD